MGPAGWLQDVKVRLESKRLQVFALTERETGDATSCDAAAKEAAGLENVRQSSCFGHVKGERPCGAWAGSRGKSLAGNTKFGMIGMWWHPRYRTKWNLQKQVQVKATAGHWGTGASLAGSGLTLLI